MSVKIQIAWHLSQGIYFEKTKHLQINPCLFPGRKKFPKKNGSSRRGVRGTRLEETLKPYQNRLGNRKQLPKRKED